MIFDELPAIYFNNIDSLIAAARSNKVVTTLAMQDFSQLKKDYGKDQADVIINIAGRHVMGGDGQTAVGTLRQNHAGQAKHVYQSGKYIHQLLQAIG